MPLYLGNEQISNVSIAFDNSSSISGTDTSDATLTSGNQMLKGVTAYSNGNKYTGTLVIQKYYTGSGEPSSSLGNDGDIYLKA